MSLPELSAVELRRLIGARQVSPVELMDACIARIDTLNPAINAICATDFERARDSAKLAEASVMRGETLGPLHGLPDRKSTRLNSSHSAKSRMPSSA
jgi:Asp-tRNA(Asn)/Glu-tRNA(Gln) amidotransferase A subunit family amidase